MFLLPREFEADLICITKVVVDFRKHLWVPLLRRLHMTKLYYVIFLCYQLISILNDPLDYIYTTTEFNQTGSYTNTDFPGIIY